MRRTTSRTTTLLALGTVLVLSAGCGSALPSGPVTLTVYADSSLSAVFPDIAQAFSAQHPNVSFRFTFEDSTVLTSQIAHAVAADVYAGADGALADLLVKPDLIDPWQPFASDRLVLIVPTSNPGGIGSWQDIGEAGRTVAVASDGTLLGTVSRSALRALTELAGDPMFDDRVLAGAADRPDAQTIVEDVAAGRVDAGFVHGIDVAATGFGVAVIELPADARVPSNYPIAVVTVSTQKGWADRFVDFVLGDRAQQMLRAAGLGPPLQATPAARASATP